MLLVHSCTNRFTSASQRGNRDIKHVLLGYFLHQMDVSFCRIKSTIVKIRMREEKTGATEAPLQIIFLDSRIKTINSILWSLVRLLYFARIVALGCKNIYLIQHWAMTPWRSDFSFRAIFLGTNPTYVSTQLEACQNFKIVTGGIPFQIILSII